jgi:hypothetical protein
MAENSDTHYITLFIFILALLCITALLVSGLMVTLSKRNNRGKTWEDAKESAIDQKEDDNIIQCFRSFDNEKIVVKLKDGKSFMVWNVAYNYDMGDKFAQITTNINPLIEDASIDSFCTDEIIEMINAENEEVIFKR